MDVVIYYNVLYISGSQTVVQGRLHGGTQKTA